MGKHDQPMTVNGSDAVKLAVGAGTFAGALALTNPAAADTYTVEAGDNLWTISQNYNTTVDELVAINHISNADELYVGQKIETSQPAQTPAPAAPKSTPAPASVTTVTTKPAVTYTVQAGDTLTDIAIAQNVSVEEIIKNSNIENAQLIFVGQELTIKPETTVKRVAPVVIPAVKYTVATGDTLWDIAKAHDVSVEDIVKNSNIENARLIFAGQELIIKPERTVSGGVLTISAQELATQTGLSEKNAQNALDIANHLMVQEGFTLEGASGALAVAERESGFNPEAVNDSGGVAGVFQWSGWSNTINGNRWEKAETRTLALDNQMKLVSTELNGDFKNVKETVGTATDPVQASLDWSRYYEGVSLEDPQTKVDALQANAQKWYDLLKDHVDFEGYVSVPLDVTAGPYSTGNTYAAGNCTWYVKDVFKARMGDYWGNAKDWAASAQREGVPTDNNPVANLTVAVFQPGSAGADMTYGHVGIVVAVNGDSVTIKEMNATAGLGKTNTRVVPKDSATYIHMDY
jgi:LysM repeat protein